eukprot:6844026-Pyramimonas_sp.AAC.1
MAAAGTIFGNSQQGNFLAWVPDNAEAQPPARHAPSFQYLWPLVKRFISWLEHSARNARRQTPPINKWWPKLWGTDFDQYARPRSCTALQAFHWPDEPDDLVTPRTGW